MRLQTHTGVSNVIGGQRACQNGKTQVTLVCLFSSLERRGHLLVFTATPFSSNDTGLQQVGVIETKSVCGPTLRIV